MRFKGTEYLGNNRCAFTVWAPLKKNMTLCLAHPSERRIAMHKTREGYFTATVDDVAPGDLYYFIPDDSQPLPDPGSHFQPLDVQGPSQVIDHAAYLWHDQQWRGLPFNSLIFYELHVGTFTPEGTFDAIIPRLDALLDTGINALQLMPIVQCPGNRNWGYDGVFPYAVQHSYGGPDGLKKLVDACHQKGIAVFLDVVYNHLGPEGNYFSQFGPYFTKQYCTPWGDALNFDNEYSDGVRDFFSDNPLFWFEMYHIDGLRLDAIHLMFDSSAVTIFGLMQRKVWQLQQKLGRPLYFIAESDLNSPRVMQSPDVGGYGFDAQWLDDFHHALYVLLDPKGLRRYADYGKMEQLAKAYKEGFVHSGEYVQARKRTYGASSAGLPGNTFVVFTMNHDQVGNRVKGDRLSTLIDFERLKLAAAAMLLSPYLPMLFMGEEYAEQVPFYYFISYSDPKLIRMVQKSRKEQLAGYGDVGTPPDPQAEKTFTDCTLDWDKRREGKHKIMHDWYKTLIALRKSNPLFQNYAKSCLTVTVLEQAGFVLQRQSEDGLQQLVCVFNLTSKTLRYRLPIGWTKASKLLDSKEEQWLEKQSKAQPSPSTLREGATLQLPPLSVVVYEKEITESDGID